MMRYWLCAALAASMVADAGHAGVIRGTVRAGTVVPAAAQLRAYPGRANALPEPGAPARGALTQAVVYVTKLPAHVDVEEPGSSRPLLVQQNQTFAPRVVPVAAGTSVGFPNRDAIYHNVFSLSPAKRFDLGKYPRGRSKTVVFDRPGLVKVYCDIHSNMEAFVFVLPNHAFTQPDENGHYTLPELPPGKYTVAAWHPDFGETQTSVEVPRGGDARADLGF